MSNTDIGHIRLAKAPIGRCASGEGLTRLNTLVFWLLVALLAIAPIPFGSARAIYWGALAAAIGLVGMVYCALLVWMRQAPRIAPAALWPQAVLWVAVCAWLVVQVLPLGGLAIPLPDGTTLDAGTISIAPGMTLLMLARQLGYGLFFFLMLQTLANGRRRRLLFDVLLCIIIAHGVYGMISLRSGDTILGLEKWAYNGYATGTFVNRNSYATFLAMGSIIAAGRFGHVLARGFAHHRDDGRPPHFWSSLVIYAVAYVFLVTVILSTASRMGLFVTVVGTIVALAVLLQGGRGKGMLLALVPVILAAIAVAMVFFGVGLFERLGGVETSAQVRGDFYRQIWELILLRPLTGFGGGSFELAFPLVHALPVSTDRVWNLAHNTYLALWSELGLVAGSLVILSVGLVAVRIGHAVIRRQGNLEAQAIALGSLVACALHSLVDFSLEIPANTLIFLALLAAGAASAFTAPPAGADR